MTSTSLKVESGLQLLARLNKKNNVLNFYPIILKDGPNPGEVIEICGNSDTGKTILLIDLICAALLPEELGGTGTEVLVIITDGNMCLDLLSLILKQKILSTIETKHYVCNRQKSDILYHESLHRLHFIEVYDAIQFYITIQNLEAVLLEHPNISLVAFDTLTAYYWSEQAYQKMDFHLKYVLKLAQGATKEHKCVIVFTRPKYFNSSKIMTENDLEECSKYQIPEWVNYRINLIAKTTNSQGNYVYQATIRTLDSIFEKSFNIINNTLLWHC